MDKKLKVHKKPIPYNGMVDLKFHIIYVRVTEEKKSSLSVEANNPQTNVRIITLYVFYCKLYSFGIGNVERTLYLLIYIFPAMVHSIVPF